ncbi:MAG: SpoIID/LytB domain-containing protein [Endomicrobiia bacterium]
MKVIILDIFLITFCFSQDILEMRKKYLEKKITDYNLLETYQFESEREKVLRDLILFEYYLDKKETDKAEKYAINLASFYPINQLINFRLGEYFFKNNLEEKAINYLENCVKKDSRFHEARKYLAQSHYNLKNYSEAYRHFNVLSWFNPEKEILRKIDYLSNHIEYNLSEVSKEKKFTQIKSLKALIQTEIPYINVGISTKDNGKLMEIDCVKFYVSGKFVIYNDSGKEIIKSEGGFDKEWMVVYRTSLRMFGIISPSMNKEYRVKSKYIFVIPETLDSTFYISEYRWFKKILNQNKEFRGRLLIKRLKNQIVVINSLPLDEYLYSVVPKEIGANAPLEALKTQAVIARTTALYRKKKKFHKYFDVCWGQHCQVYEGISGEQDSASYAVNHTIGEVITDRTGNLVNTFFHANCGGISVVSCCFYNDEEIVYDYKNKTLPKPEENKDIYFWYILPEIFDCNCKASYYVHDGTFRWLRTIKEDLFSKHLNSKYKIGKLKNILVVSRRKNLYINKLKIIGTERIKTLTLEHEIRNILPNGSLRSASFFVEYNKNTQTYYFWGAGWGHGIGMCQGGSCNLSVEGKNYIEIIKHYYKEVNIKKIY